ncbi:Transposase IS4 [Popillia japonica]|uniref:Transposase IS4 n=1 Tax=Popillia japonica TaxID=7064 RepID=A0AAW1J1W2_POPJA
MVVTPIGSNFIAERNEMKTKVYLQRQKIKELLDHKTHLIGTLRSNRNINPKILIDKKLKTGETVAEESSTGVIVQKWKDGEEEGCPHAKHEAYDEMCPTKRREKEILKPKNVVENNKYKKCVQLNEEKKKF